MRLEARRLWSIIEAQFHIFPVKIRGRIDEMSKYVFRASAYDSTTDTRETRYAQQSQKRQVWFIPLADERGVCRCEIT